MSTENTNTSDKNPELNTSDENPELNTNPETAEISFEEIKKAINEELLSNVQPVKCPLCKYTMNRNDAIIDTPLEFLTDVEHMVVAFICPTDGLISIFRQKIN